MTTALVFLGAMAGAPLRYLTDRVVQARRDSQFPLGTVLVNVAGCLVLGVLSALAVPAGLLSLLGTGFCGALTTYSTFGYETVRLAERKAYRHAVLNVIVTLVAGLGAALLGHAVVAALTG